jgi:hypothetical protein
MSKDSKAAPGQEKCLAEECKKKQEKFGFCMEHYEWYMEGVLKGNGKKPSDFAEKLALFTKRKAPSKVA